MTLYRLFQNTLTWHKTMRSFIFCAYVETKYVLLNYRDLFNRLRNIMHRVLTASNGFKKNSSDFLSKKQFSKVHSFQILASTSMTNTSR